MRVTLLLAGLVLAAPASAANLISNGDFETGSLGAWSLNVLGTSNGTGAVITNGSPAPISGNATAFNPGGGNWVYSTGQSGPGTYDLRQSFFVTTAGNYTIAFDHFANNFAGATIVDPIGLDHTGAPNQHARVDLLVGTAIPFTTSPADVLWNFYLGADAGPNPNPWTSYSVSVGLTPGFYILRFGQTDNQSFFSQGVDNVSVTGSAVPEPATWAMMIAGFGLVGGTLRRRSTARVSA